MHRLLISLALFASSTLAGYWAFAPKGLCFVRSPGDTAWRSWAYVDSASVSANSHKLGGYAAAEYPRLAVADSWTRRHIWTSSASSYVGNACGVSIEANSAGSGFICANALSPADPTVGICNGANFGFNGSTSNFYGIGIGALRNGKYDIWHQTGIGNGGGYRWYIATTEKMTMDKTGMVGVGITAPTQALSVAGSESLTTNMWTGGWTHTVGTDSAAAQKGLAVIGSDSVKTSGKFIFGGVAIDSNQYINDTLYWWKAGKRGVMGVFATP